MRLPLLLALTLAGVAPAAAADAPLPADQAAIRAHVAFLASDALNGREAGTPDYDVAAEYVAARMGEAGLEPAGDAGSYFQKVRLAATRLTEHGAAAVTRGGASTKLVFGADFLNRPSFTDAALDISAPVVFAGYGVSDPAQGIDDYRGLDVRGKIVALLYGGPPGLQSEVRAHLGSREVKAAVAAAHGARGMVLIESASLAKIRPFAQFVPGWAERNMTWADAKGTPFQPGVPYLGLISLTGAARLFAGSPLDWRTIRAADAAGKPVPHGEIGAALTMRTRSAIEQLTSSNVVGVLRGTDPTLAAQYVVLSAHLDHIGVTAPVKGDAINNGAMDNAIGIAAMLEVARSFGRGGDRPRRSLLFVAVTAEEKGLVGSDYFARHPTVPATSMVADVNLDMPILTYRFRDLVAFGADRSTLGPVVAAAAAAEGAALTPDPEPEQAIFVRSDHYSFVRAGVPAVLLETGPAGPGAKAIAEFNRSRYHRPADDLSQPIDWAAAASFVRINRAIAASIANAPDRPRWNKGDYFGTLFKGPMAE